MDIVGRSKYLLTTNLYSVAEPMPVFLNWDYLGVPMPELPRQYVLRMILRRHRENDFLFPPELNWARPWVYQAHYEETHRFKVARDFCYITVRHGEVTSTTDDLWHVDGFSLRKPHFPERNYVWTSNHHTEFLNQRFIIPPDFDPLRHDIQSFFQAYADGPSVMSNGWTLFDPYVVHRRPRASQGKKRTMVRISFVPIPIEDGMNTHNRRLPDGPWPVNKFRDTLTRY